MKTRLVLGPALLGMLLGFVTTAAAQKPEENYVSDSYFNFVSDPADTTTMVQQRQMATSAAALLAAENIFYLKNARYTAQMQELPNWKPTQDISLFVTAGSTWISVRALPSVPSSSRRELHVLAWRNDGPRVESGRFSAVRSTGQR